MKLIKFLFVGLLFGFILVKSEVISWFRIQEMFRFQSFHMYGIIGSAVILGAIIIMIIKATKMKDSEGEEIVIPPKDMSVWRYLLGGTIFGLGWAMTGACPGPTFALVGYGMMSFIIVLIFGVLGTYVYGKISDKLPH